VPPHERAAREITLDGEIVVPNDRGVAPIDDLQDAIAGQRPVIEPEQRPGWRGPAFGAFWKPADPALISLLGPA
jgi:hypothetical protein